MIPPLYTEIDTAQLWLWAVFAGCRLVVDRAEPIGDVAVLPRTGL